MHFMQYNTGFEAGDAFKNQIIQVYTDFCPETQSRKERQANFSDLPKSEDNIFLFGLRLLLVCKSCDLLIRFR